MKILTVVGTRPEVIKMAPVIKTLENNPQIESCVCVTSQHKEMVKPLIDFFGIVPDYDLNVMRPDQTLHDVASSVIQGLLPVFKSAQPDWVLVQGDTTTTLAAALSAKYAHIRVGHVEAGLRTGDDNNPFPEEMNRRVTDHLSDLHFAATSGAKNNLLAEGVSENTIFITGNTVIDALYLTLDHIKNGAKTKTIEESIYRQIKTAISDKRIILVTVHRRESFGAELNQIFLGLRKLAETFDDILVIYPVHLNPNVRKQAFEILKGIKRILLIEPLDYPSFVWLMDKSHLVLTDSGGLQEEAPALGKPVLVLRHKTERPEIIESGVGKVVGTSSTAIFETASHLLTNEYEYRSMAKGISPFGDGQASGRIVDALIKNSKR